MLPDTSLLSSPPFPGAPGVGAMLINIYVEMSVSSTPKMYSCGTYIVQICIIIKCYGFTVNPSWKKCPSGCLSKEIAYNCIRDEASYVVRWWWGYYNRQESLNK
jgi:hypothetical protein